MDFSCKLSGIQSNHHHWAISLQFQRQIHRQKQRIRRDHRGRSWEEKGKNSRIPNRFRRKRRRLPFKSQVQAKKSAKQNQDSRFPKVSTQISRLNTGNTRTQSHTVKKPSRVRKQRESMEDSNCLVRNPNPNIKTVWKRRESLQDSQRVWIEVIPCWFTRIELKKHEESQTVRTYRQNQGFVLIPRLKTPSSNGFVLRATIQSVWAQNGWFLSSFEWVRVRVSGRRREKAKRRERTKWENEGNRFIIFLYKPLNRVGSNPTHSPVFVAFGSWS